MCGCVCNVGVMCGCVCNVGVMCGCVCNVGVMCRCVCNVGVMCGCVCNVGVMCRCVCNVGVMTRFSHPQDVDLSPDPADRTCLYLSVHQTSPKKRPALPPKFQFKDHISCLAAKKCLLNNKDKLRMAKMSRIRKLFQFPDHATVAAEGAFATADETASSSSDSDTSLVVVHSTLVPNRSQCSPQPPPSHYIELTTLSSPPFDPTNPPDPHSEDDVDVHLDSSTLQAIIRIHKSKTQQDNGQLFNEPEENSSHGDKEETEQQL